MDKRLGRQLKEYEKHGFTVKTLEPSRGSHVRVVFNEFSEPQFLTVHAGDPRALKNNIARFKRLAKESVEEKTKEEVPNRST
jgi:hypothetical protein